VAALGIAGPIFRIKMEDADRLGASVKSAAAEITSLLGGTHPARR
jgi:DNA-binding IclR family transcriptional regulator